MTGRSLAPLLAVLALTGACSSSSSGPTTAATPPASVSPSPAGLPAGLVAGSYYVFAHPHAAATVGSSDAVMFDDAAHASVRLVILGQAALEHDQLSIAGDQMTFSHGLPGGEPCDTS